MNIENCGEIGLWNTQKNNEGEKQVLKLLQASSVSMI